MGQPPRGALQIGVLVSADHVELGLGAHGAGAIVAEGHKVQRAALQDLVIARLGVQGHTAAAKQVAGVGGVVAAGHHIDEEQAFAAALHLAEHILRLAGGGVDLAQGIHGTKLGAGHHLVAQLDGLCAGKEHVVHGVVVGLVVGAGGAAGGVAAHGVDLVEGEPVAAPHADALKQGAAVVQVAVDGVAALPAVVLLGQSGGQLIVMDGDEWLHAVLFQLVDEVQIELQALFVGCCSSPVGKIRLQQMEKRYTL